VATTTVQMDYKVISDVSKGFKTSADVLNTVAKVLEVLINILRSMAFASMGTTLALANYLEQIKNKIKPLAKLCTEFSGDLAAAVGDHRKGDIAGKRYFGEGVRR